MIEIDEKTGEMIVLTEEFGQTAPERYADLEDQVTALRIDRRQRVEELTETDARLCELDRHIAAARAEQADITKGWQEQFDDLPPGSQKLGRVRITKPKPRVTWKLGWTARQIAEPKAATEIARIIDGVLDATSDPDVIAGAIIAWLAPESNTGEQKPITVKVGPPA